MHVGNLDYALSNNNKFQSNWLKISQNKLDAYKEQCKYGNDFVCQ